MQNERHKTNETLCLSWCAHIWIYYLFWYIYLCNVAGSNIEHCAYNYICNKYIANDCNLTTTKRISKPPARIELATPGLQDQCSSHWAMEACRLVSWFSATLEKLSTHDTTDNSGSRDWHMRTLNRLRIIHSQCVSLRGNQQQEQI